MPACGNCGAAVLESWATGTVGKGEVLIGELVPVAGDGATEDGRDHPAVDEVTAGLAVNLVVTSRECDEVGCIEGRAMNITDGNQALYIEKIQYSMKHTSSAACLGR